MPLPAILAAAGAVGSAVSGLSQAGQGRRVAQDAQRALNNYQRQSFTNAAQGLQVRTEGQEFQAAQTDRSLATNLDYLRQGGSFTNATALTNQALDAKANIAKTIEQQRNRVDQLKVQEEQNIRSLIEARERADLAGLGSQIQYGNQLRAGGIAAVGSGFGQLATAAAGGVFKRGGNLAGQTGQQYNIQRPVTQTNTNPVRVQDANPRLNIPSTFNVY